MKWYARIFAASWIALTFVVGRCSAQQSGQHPWEVDAKAALVLTAHALDMADALAAHQYLDQVNDGGNVTALDAQYADQNRIRHLARPIAIAAQSALEARNFCQALGSILELRGLIGPGNEAAEALVSVISSGPSCQGDR